MINLAVTYILASHFITISERMWVFKENKSKFVFFYSFQMLLMCFKELKAWNQELKTKNISKRRNPFGRNLKKLWAKRTLADKWVNIANATQKKDHQLNKQLLVELLSILCLVSQVWLKENFNQKWCVLGPWSEWKKKNSKLRSNIRLL